MITREPWRFTYTFSNSELLENMRSIRKGTLESVSYMLRREVILQSEERGMIKLPENTAHGDAHLIPFSALTILNDLINNDDPPLTKH